MSSLTTPFLWLYFKLWSKSKTFKSCVYCVVYLFQVSVGGEEQDTCDTCSQVSVTCFQVSPAPSVPGQTSRPCPEESPVQPCPGSSEPGLYWARSLGYYGDRDAVTMETEAGLLWRQRCTDVNDPLSNLQSILKLRQTQLQSDWKHQKYLLLQTQTQNSGE